MTTLSFMGFLQARPELVKAVVEPALQKLVTAFTGVRTNYTTAAALPTLAGDTRTMQQGRANLATSAFGSMITGVNQGQQATSAGAAQLQIAKTQLTATVTSAKAAGFDVLPDGQVRVSAQQRAYCHATWTHGGRELLRMLEAWAAQYTAQIRGTLTQAGAVDAQIATALVKLATEYLTSLFQKTSSPAATAGTLPGTVPSGTTGPSTVIPGSTGLGTTLPAGTGADLGVGTTLAGAAPLGGGVGSIGSGPASVGLTGAGAAGAAGAAALAGTTGAGVVGVGPGAAAAAAGRGLAGGAVPMAGAGAHGANREEGTHGAEDWLVEDGESWSAGDAPEGVIS